MFEKEAEERARKLEEKQILGVYDNDEDLARDEGVNEGQVVGYEEGFKDGAEFGYNKGKTETALLSQHILDLQKDKGNLTDRVRELEQQIEKMKCCSNCAFQLVIGGVRDRHCVKCNACSEWELED